MGTVKKRGYVNTLRLELRPVRSVGLGYIVSGQERFIHRYCASPLQIGFPLVLSGGPHLDFEALQWTRATAEVAVFRLE